MASSSSSESSGRWWLRVLAASAALAGVLLLVAYMTPAVNLHYPAWRYRRARRFVPSPRSHDTTILETAVRKLLARRASVNLVVALLGQPARAWREKERGIVLYYEHVPHSSYWDYRPPERGKKLVFQNGILRDVRSMTLGDFWRGIEYPYSWTPARPSLADILAEQ